MKDTRGKETITKNKHHHTICFATVSHQVISYMNNQLFTQFSLVSGQVPAEPVVSKKSGHLFEKRLLLKYLEEHENKCPMTGEHLTPDDLLDVTSKATGVTPRPVTATSIPGLLQMLSNEWDSLMLETFTLKQQFNTSKQELSHSLYQHDAACRVISRLMKERDEAKKYVFEIQH
jgi:pre-mRNA-processing factor 19